MNYYELLARLKEYSNDFKKKRAGSLAPLAFGYDFEEYIGRFSSKLAIEAFGEDKKGYSTEIRKGMNLRRLHNSDGRRLK